MKGNARETRSRVVKGGGRKRDCRGSRRCWRTRRSSRKWRRRRRMRMNVRLTSCRTSAAVRCPAAALPDSSRCCRSAHSASPPAGSPPHTWCTPPSLCLGEGQDKRGRGGRGVHSKSSGSTVKMWPMWEWRRLTCAGGAGPVAGLTGPAMAVVVITSAARQLASVPLKTRRGGKNKTKYPHHRKFRNN